MYKIEDYRHTDRCNAACRVEMGAVQWRYWRERERCQIHAMMVSVGVIHATVGARAIWVRGCVRNAAVILVVVVDVVDYVDDASWWCG